MTRTGAADTPPASSYMATPSPMPDGDVDDRHQELEQWPQLLGTPGEPTMGIYNNNFPPGDPSLRPGLQSCLSPWSDDITAEEARLRWALTSWIG